MNDLPSGPRRPKVLQALAFGRDPTGFLDHCAREYGDAFTLRMPNDPPRVVVSDPAGVKAMFSLRPDAYRSDNLAVHLNLGRQSLLFRDGEQHRQLRKLMTPTLQAKRVQTYAETMQAVTRAALQRWPVDEEFALLPRMSDIALDVVLQCVLGASGDDEDDALRRQALHWLGGTLSPGMFATGMLVNAYRLRRVLDRAVDKARGHTGGEPWLFRNVARAKAQLLRTLGARIARCRRGEGGERQDVLALLVAARYDDGEAMSDEDILDQLITFLVGGHETTANTLAWTLSLVTRRPEILARIKAELREHFGDGPVDPSRASKLRYLDACIKESMRLAPVSPGPIRTLTRDCEIPGYTLRSGTAIWASIYLANRRPQTWTDPASFRPERFLGSDQPAPNEFFPFGGGARRCLGVLFAEFEMRIVLAEILQHHEVRPTSDPPAPVFAGISLSPADGVPVKVRPAPPN